MQAVTVYLGGIAADTVDYRKKETRVRVLFLESALLEEKKKLMALEEQGEMITRVQADSTGARLRVLEMQARMKRTPAALRSWFGSRQDVLAECDWKSPDEAVAWVEENAGRVTR